MAVPPLSYLFSGNINKEIELFLYQVYLTQKQFIVMRVVTTLFIKVTDMVLIIQICLG